MSEPQAPDATPATSPGALLRQARERKGVTLQALSEATKVAVSRLEALEADRWAALPDLAYARNLAHTVCRALETDPSVVMAGLPAATRHALERVDEGLHEPFREHTERSRAGPSGTQVARVVAALAAAVLAWIVFGSSAVSRLWALVDTPSGLAVAPAPGAGASAAMAGAPEAGRAAGGDALRLQASAECWVEIVDRDGRVVASRTLAAGESIDIDAALPLRLTLGNARAAEVLLRGQPVDLGAHTNDNNVARLELR